MANGTCQPNFFERAVRIKGALNPKHGIELDQIQGHRGIVEIHFSMFQLLDELLRQGLRIHLQAHSQGRARADTGAHTTQVCAFYGAMQLKGVAPEGFVTERVKPEDLLALRHHLSGVLEYRLRIRALTTSSFV